MVVSDIGEEWKGMRDSGNLRPKVRQKRPGFTEKSVAGVQ